MEKPKTTAKNTLDPSTLSDLAQLSQTKEWETLCKVMDNRVSRDKNAIVSYPEDVPVKLATMKAFYRGRMSAIFLIKREVSNAGRELDKIEEKK